MSGGRYYNQSISKYIHGGEPADHAEAVYRVRRLLEDRNFICTKDAATGKYNIPLKGIREYWPDLLVEHPVIEWYKFIVELDGGYHFTDYKVKTNEIENHDQDLMYIFTVKKKLKRTKIFHFLVEEVIGKYAMPDSWILEKLGIESQGSGGRGQWTQ